MLCQGRYALLAFSLILMACQNSFGAAASDSLRRVIQTAEQDSVRQAARRKLVRYYWSHDLDSAHQAGLDYLEVAEQNKSPFEIGEAENVLGITCLYQAKFAEAVQHFDRLLTLKQEEGDSSFIASTLNNTAIAHTQVGNFPLALQCYQESLEIKEAMKDSAAIQGSLNNIGAIYLALEDYDRAREYFEQGLHFPSKFKDDNSYASNHANIGYCLFKAGQMEAALQSFKEGLTYAEKDGNPSLIGVLKMHLGEYFLVLKDFGRAEAYSKESLQILGDLGQEDRVLEVQVLMGQICLAQGQASKSLDHCQKGLKIAIELDALYEQGECIQCIGSAQRKLGKYPEALLSMDRAQEIRDSLRSESLHRQIVLKDLEYGFQRQKMADSLNTVQQNEILRLGYEAKWRNQRFFIYALVLGILFFLCLAAMYYMNSRRKKKMNDKLREMVRLRTSDLEQQNKQLAEYAFINAHHLRGPLTQIQGLLELLENVSSDEERMEYLSMLRTSTERLDKVIHEIRDAVEKQPNPIRPITERTI